MSDCSLSRDNSGGLGIVTYYNTSSLDFGVLQAIMSEFLLWDHETYERICSIDLQYSVTSTGDENSDPENKATLSYCEADAEAVNWIAANVFNTYDESLQDELKLSSGLDRQALFYYPLYLHEGKYYYCPGQRGGPGIEIKIENVSVEDGFYMIEYKDGTWWNDPDEDLKWSPFIKRARMQYKYTTGRQGYWSIYSVYSELQDQE